MAWDFYAIKDQTKKTVLNIAYAYLDKDKAFRLWGASHGGVYVEKTASTPANQLLSHVAERDIITPSGRELTLMNPAYMMRQMMETFAQQSGTSGHLTSINPINPINQPDEWERSVMLSFEKDLVESVAEFRLLRGREHLRVMIPFVTKQGCLKCHAIQGYKVGDIRGGTSVSIPMAPYYALETTSKTTSITTHVGIFLCGLLGILLGFWKIRLYMRSQRRMTESAREQHEFINTIINSLSHPFYVVDVNTYEIILANSAAKEHGDGSLSFCYVLGHNRDTPCCGKEHPCPMQQVIKNKKLVTVEHFHFDKEGNPLNVEVQCFPVLDSNGEVSQVIEYCYDITERKKAEKEKLLLMEQLQQSQKMEAIGTLAGGVAHDFNNILTAINGNSELAKLNLNSNIEDAEKNLDKVLLGSARARDLVKQILTFSRITVQEKQPSQLSLIVSDALKLLRASIPTTIEINQDIKSQSLVLADSTQIHQVVMNLCTNAYHAMRDKGGTLGISLKDVDVSQEMISNESKVVPGTYIQLEVSDNGCGMDAKTKCKIFEPYFTTKESEEGTGLGLAVVFGIIESHNGYINVYSKIGQGTTFQVYLPIVKNETKDPLLTNKDKVDMLTGGSETIMLIDDEDVITDVEESVLSKYGYEVSTFNNGELALKAFRENKRKYDLIITDMTMPHITGLDLSKIILEIEPDMPIIICTGHSELLNREKALSVGISEYCEKPLSIKTLLSTVRSVLDKKRLQS
ncbi:MAG: DUF3365 domain-containing protein [Desulfobulbaceae bacterium]|nr:DUF3365 domain-containing protein [Desulfobulbaceae bacterium]